MEILEKYVFSSGEHVLTTVGKKFYQHTVTLNTFLNASRFRSCLEVVGFFFFTELGAAYVHIVITREDYTLPTGLRKYTLCYSELSKISSFFSVTKSGIVPILRE